MAINKDNREKHPSTWEARYLNIPWNQEELYRSGVREKRRLTEKQTVAGVQEDGEPHLVRPI